MPTIRVVVRFRPINTVEKDQAREKGWAEHQLCPLFVDERNLMEFESDSVSQDERVGTQVRCCPEGIPRSSQPKFAFDEVLVWVSQQTAFERIGLPVIRDALNGINGTIFAYGQTGSGKTFSMFGKEPLTNSNAELLGVIPRCCAEIFTVLSSDPTVKQYRIDVSFFEIYIHNTIRDLLHPAKKGDPPLKVRDGPKGVFIEHLKPETAMNLDEILTLIALANSHRTVSSTKMNATSSRSHSVMRVTIRIERKDGSRARSMINFGDLAGSEKVAKTGATGQTLKEAQAINQSLTLLGNVIAALAKIGSGKKKGGSMVPFRDSALTHVLKDSLAGNCKTTLVTAASPHRFNLLETVSTFRFGSRCKLVKTKAEKNVVLSPSQMKKLIGKLQLEIKQLKMQLLKGGSGTGNALNVSSGIGVKITWPNDYGAWTKDKKVWDALYKQINAQIKSVIQTGVATNSDDVDNMPYVIHMSNPGDKRKVIIQFHADDDDDAEYDRKTCIELSKKLCEEIEKINKDSLQPAMKNYKLCKYFSEPSSQELKQVIDSQKLQITFLTEENSKSKEELTEKAKEIENLQQTMGDSFETASMRSKTEFGHSSQLTFLSSIGNSYTNLQTATTMPLFRAESIFNSAADSTSSGALKVTDLLAQLLHSKYEVLRTKRKYQLLQVRFASEQKRMGQLRYIVSRMQAEFLDLKATSLVSKAVLSNVAEHAASSDESAPEQNLSLKHQITQHSINASLLNSEDEDFVSSALDDIMNDLDDGDSASSNKPPAATPGLLRKLSSITTMQQQQSDSTHGQKRRHSMKVKKRRASAGQVAGSRKKGMSTATSALGGIWE